MSRERRSGLDRLAGGDRTPSLDLGAPP